MAGKFLINNQKKAPPDFHPPGPVLCPSQPMPVNQSIFFLT